jgi:23S rRNA pseudouridine1911/1915/1917 synthase
MTKKARKRTSRQPLETETKARPVEIKIEETQAGERVDKLVAAVIEKLSRSAVQKLIEEGLVTVNAAPVKASYRLDTGDLVLVSLPPSEPAQILPEPIPLAILYQDASIIVVDKPAGMVTHPAHGHTSGTLVNALLALYPPLAQMDVPERAGIVHRLDKDTSGIIVVAKTEAVRQAIQAQFKAREVQKTYLALVEGHLVPAQGIIEAPIGRDPNNRKRLAVLRGGREAVTIYRVLEFFERHSLVQVEPKTGRTHQIRVHMASVHCPIVGDRVYGYRRPRLLLQRHFLHAQHIRFRHPATGQMVEFNADLPAELTALLERLRAETPRIDPCCCKILNCTH